MRSFWWGGRGPADWHCEVVPSYLPSSRCRLSHKTTQPGEGEKNIATSSPVLNCWMSLAIPRNQSSTIEAPSRSEARITFRFLVPHDIRRLRDTVDDPVQVVQKDVQESDTVDGGGGRLNIKDTSRAGPRRSK